MVAKFFLFIFGAIFAVLVGLTIWDEDVINVEHVFTIMTLSGAVAGLARSLIPDEVCLIKFKIPSNYRLIIIKGGILSPPRLVKKVDRHIRTLILWYT